MPWVGSCSSKKTLSRAAGEALGGRGAAEGEVGDLGPVRVRWLQRRPEDGVALGHLEGGLAAARQLSESTPLDIQVTVFAMGCLVALFALISPRLALFAIWIFSNWLDRAFDDWIVPVLGF